MTVRNESSHPEKLIKKSHPNMTAWDTICKPS